MTKRNDPQYKLRMPPDMHRDLKAFAKANHRSMNAEIIHRLEAGLGSANRNKEHRCEAD